MSYSEDIMEVIESFADDSEDISVYNGAISFMKGGEIQEVRPVEKGGRRYVDLGGDYIEYNKWISLYLGRLDVLAQRIKKEMKIVDNYIDPRYDRFPSLFNDHKPKSHNGGLLDVLSDDITANPMQTKVVFITSEAGGGKTTLLNKWAHGIANKYNKSVDPLVLPIELGGKSFVKLEELIIGIVVNKYRFTALYYDSLLQLMKRNYVVLALDGFEETVVTGSPDESIMSLANMINSFGSKGVLLIAARSSYFDYRYKMIHKKLLSQVAKNDVEFYRYDLSRWGKNQFIEYWSRRGLGEGEKYYKIMNDKEKNHPFISRPVIIEKIADIASGIGVDEAIKRLESEASYRLHVLIKSIIEREVNTKWMSQEPGSSGPLMSVDQHLDLLSEVSIEMFRDNNNHIKIDMMQFVTNLFATENKLGALAGMRIAERISDHPLLIHQGRGLYTFDHEEFYYYFIARGIFNYCQFSKKSDIASLFNGANISFSIIDQFVQMLIIKSVDPQFAIKIFDQVKQDSEYESHVVENSSNFITALLPVESSSPKNVKKLLCSSVLYEGVNIKDVEINSSEFNSLSFSRCKFDNFVIRNSSIAMLDLDKKSDYSGMLLDSTEVRSIDIDGATYYEPKSIIRLLRKTGLINNDNNHKEESDIYEYDEKYEMLERFFRAFYKATQISDNVVKVRMGKKYSIFEKSVLEDIIKNKLILRLDAEGDGSKSFMYKINVSLSELYDYFHKSSYQYEKCIEAVGVRRFR